MSDVPMPTGAGTPTGAHTGYPPEAALLVARYSKMLQGLPVVLMASLLSAARDFDLQFVPERWELQAQLAYLAKPRSAQTRDVLAAFQALPVPTALRPKAWTQPAAFLEEYTALLWQTHTIDSFRACGEAYGVILQTIRAQMGAPTSSTSSKGQLVMVLLGQGADRTEAPLFTRLRAHGTFFPTVDGAGLLHDAQALLRDRASEDGASIDRDSGLRAAHNHWLIDGGELLYPASLDAVPHTCVSFTALGPVRDSLAQRVRHAMASASFGPERVRSYMMELRSEDLSGFRTDQDPVQRHFITRILCNGSGTQTLSTTFVQWAAREALRRAQPATLLVRFAPRSNQLSFLDQVPPQAVLDANGALRDADMGAFYTWLNMKRSVGAGRQMFLAAAENGQGALAIGPGMAAGAIAENRVSLRRIVQWMEA